MTVEYSLKRRNLGVWTKERSLRGDIYCSVTEKK